MIVSGLYRFDTIPYNLIKSYFIKPFIYLYYILLYNGKKLCL